MFCSNCGKPLSDGARFCADCGTAVNRKAGMKRRTAPHASPEQEPRKILPLWKLLLLAVLVMGIGALLGQCIADEVFDNYIKDSISESVTAAPWHTDDM